MTNETHNLPLLPLARNWWRDSRQARGGVASLRHLAAELWFLLRDNTPERRRSRFGDIEYDFDHAVDTTWARLPLRVRLREIFTERLYQPTVPEEFDALMAELGAVDFSGYTFTDLGSGKGRVLLMASRHPFAAIEGVEIQPELHRAAERNLAAFNDASMRCCNFHLYCCDARAYEFPPVPLLLYLFNPFPGYVLAAVIDRLAASLARQPRPVYLAYNAPFEQQTLESALARNGNFLRRIAVHPQFVIYSNVEGRRQ
jgi:predicted RNA methylase